MYTHSCIRFIEFYFKAQERAGVESDIGFLYLQALKRRRMPELDDEYPWWDTISMFALRNSEEGWWIVDQHVSKILLELGVEPECVDGLREEALRPVREREEREAVRAFRIFAEGLYEALWARAIILASYQPFYGRARQWEDMVTLRVLDDLPAYTRGGQGGFPPGRVLVELIEWGAAKWVPMARIPNVEENPAWWRARGFLLRGRTYPSPRRGNPSTATASMVVGWQQIVASMVTIEGMDAAIRVAASQGIVFGLVEEPIPDAVEENEQGRRWTF